MSETNTNPLKTDADHPAMNHIDSASRVTGSGAALLEWSYSGKSFRGLCLLFWIITLLVLGGAAYLTLIGKQMADSFTMVWMAAIVVSAVFWIYFIVVYIYRTYTLKYRLTTHSLDTHRGFFTTTWDTMELINIEDLAVRIRLYDKIFNGGVGTISIYSKTDKTDENGLTLRGVENPQEVFDLIKKTRDEIRARRALIS